MLYLRQGAHTVTVNAALERFRAGASTTVPAATATTVAAADPGAAAATGGSPTPGAARAGAPATAKVATGPSGASASSTRSGSSPADGVYVYATQGYEATNALGGARYDYPAQSTVTIQRSDCGWSERWQPLQERWDTWTFCNIAEGQWSKHLASYHEFFKKSQQQDFDCGTAAVWRPVNPQVGAQRRASCSGSGGATNVLATLVSLDDMTVGGQQLHALHIHFDLTFTGSNRGSGTQDRWLDRATGLMLKMGEDFDLQSSSPFGDVHYEEHFKLDLTSVTPQR
jgi:hypothetical protein